ncbi:MAG: GGDEF domain-containing protein [Actinomycetota bacterium]|nr:GGDEF domain-containing protein [Actinomycetota bacterium]
MRDQTATSRLETAEERDRSAELRDRGAAGRDRVARLHDQEYDADASREDILLRAERDRARAAADRAKAADDRYRAAGDRSEAAAERVAARHHLELAATDELTGTLTRTFGLSALIREVERARRTGSPLMLAFIDVDRLKQVNDTQGHSAGDRLLHLIATTIRANVRPYDLIMRYGGDEFLCAMPNLSRAGAEERMKKVSAGLTAAAEGCSITFGLAQHEDAEGVQELISRADADLLKARAARRGQGSPA